MKRSMLVAFLAAAAAVFLTACSGPSPTVITGTLVGHDGEPMLAAGVRVSSWSVSYQPDSINTGAVFQDAENGRFEIETFETGLLSVQFAGAYHEDHVLPIYADTAMAIVVDVRLGTAEHPEEFETVEAQVRLGDSDDDEEVELTKQPDGLYTAEIETTDSLVTYSLFARGDDAYYSGHGTDSDEFVFSRGYESVIRPSDGVARIVFDPSKLTHEERTAVTTFADPSSFPARFAAVRERAEERTEAFYDAWRESDDEDFEYDWSADIADLEAAIDAEQDLVLRQTLLFELLSVKSDGGDIEPNWLSRGLEEISPTSPLWAFEPRVLVSATRAIEFPDTTLEDSVRAGLWLAALDSAEVHDTQSRPAALVLHALNEHPDPEVQAELLVSLLYSANSAGDTGKAASYFYRLAENHPNYSMLDYLRSVYSPDRNIAAGKMIPEFSVATLEDSTQFHTHEDFSGTVYLIDFWATWCGPCIAELPSVHEAYDRYKDQGFEILSIAVGDDREDIAEFRRDEFPMPWFHAFHHWEDEAVAEFEVQGIPRAILVDADGVILASDSETRGERLFEALERALGGNN